jgi:hypothetical protein
LEFSIKPFLKRLAIKPFLKRFALSRQCRNTAFSIKPFLKRLAIKPFLKRFALRHLITPLLGVFDQAFFEKACGQAYFEKACETETCYAVFSRFKSSTFKASIFLQVFFGQGFTCRSQL